jgi:hypothetical protein
MADAISVEEQRDAAHAELAPDALARALDGFQPPGGMR